MQQVFLTLFFIAVLSKDPQMAKLCSHRQDKEHTASVPLLRKGSSFAGEGKAAKGCNARDTEFTWGGGTDGRRHQVEELTDVHVVSAFPGLHLSQMVPCSLPKRQGATVLVRTPPASSPWRGSSAFKNWRVPANGLDVAGRAPCTFCSASFRTRQSGTIASAVQRRQASSAHPTEPPPLVAGRCECECSRDTYL